MKVFWICLGLSFLFSLANAASAFAETRCASATITGVEGTGAGITFTTETGETVRTEPGSKGIEVSRRGEKIAFKDLKPGEKIWIMWRPGKKNLAALIKADPDVPRETGS